MAKEHHGYFYLATKYFNLKKEKKNGSMLQLFLFSYKGRSRKVTVKIKSPTLQECIILLLYTQVLIQA